MSLPSRLAAPRLPTTVMVQVVPIELLPVHVVEGQDRLLLLLRIKRLPFLV
jgi:hypothetical protein